MSVLHRVGEQADAHGKALIAAGVYLLPVSIFLPPASLPDTLL